MEIISNWPKILIKPTGALMVSMNLARLVMHEAESYSLKLAILNFVWIEQ